MSLKISKLHIHDPQRAARTGEILIQPASENSEADLFVLIEIDSNSPDDLNFIRQFLEITFGVYENSQLHQAEKILENILQTLNENLREIAPKSFDWFKKLHCFIGLVEGSNLHFTVLGKIKAYLIKPAGLKDAVGQTPEPDKNNLFDCTFSGQLLPGDHFLISTESLTNYIALEKIRKVVSTLPPASAIAHLTNILESVPPTVSFFSIIIKYLGSETFEATLDSTRAQKGRLKIPTGSENSMAQLLATQAETEKILTPPSIFESLKEGLKKKAKPAYGRQAKQKVKKPSAGKLSLAVKRLISFFVKTGLVIKTLWLFVTQRQIRGRFFEKITDRLTKGVKKFNRMSKKNKLAIIGTLVLILVFSQSLIWQDRRLSKLRLEETYDKLAVQINEKQQAIEASLIYNDTIRAKQLLKEIDILLKQLPQESKNQQQSRQEYENKIQVLFEKVWRVTNVLEPVSLINFREINLTAEISHLGIKDKYIYGFNNTNQVFAVNVDDNTTLVLENFNLKAALASYFPKNNSLIIVTDNNEFYAVDQNELRKAVVGLPTGVSRVDYLAFYLDKMYLLNKQDKQIYRLTSSDRDFVSLTNWVREDLPLDKTISLAVDGSIYALQESGEVIKLSGGRNQGFPSLVIEPELNSPTKIFTDENSQNLYILDPTNKRLTIFSKNGELVNQYYSDKFNNLKDFLIDEAGQKAYLLNGAQVFVISLK